MNLMPRRVRRLRNKRSFSTGSLSDSCQKTGYFSAKEIRNLLNLLQVFDNPRSEIELFGALTGWFGKFEEEEIAIIRGLSKCELYDAISQISDGSFEYLDKNGNKRGLCNNCVR